MKIETLAAVSAVTSNLLFAAGCMGFTYFARKCGALWMNFFKAALALICIVICLVALSPSTFQNLRLEKTWILLLGGFIGLGVGDMFLLSAFKILGSARTLVLFGFQPLLIASFGTLYLGQDFGPMRIVSIAFMMACLVVFSLESKKQSGSWGVRGLAIGFVAILFDATSWIFSRLAFERVPDLTPLEGQFFRVLGACLCYLLISFFKPIQFVHKFKDLTYREKKILFASAFAGTFLSITLFMYAIKVGHLAMISGISITSPVFAALFEQWITRKPFSRHLIVALFLFACGFLVALQA